MAERDVRNATPSPKARRAKRVDARFADWAEFLDAQLEIEPAGLFLAGRYDLEVGEVVGVRCLFPGDRDGVRIQGRVHWRRIRGGTDEETRPGLGVAVSSVSMTAYRRLLETAEGKVAGLAGRKEERFPAKMPVQCSFGRHAQVVVSGEVSDVSLQGAALRVAHRPSVDDPVVLLIDDAEAGSCKYEGFVAWVRGAVRGPGAATQVGVHFQFCRPEDCRVWERLVSRARAEARLSTEYPSD